jgi:hypothetical protein
LSLWKSVESATSVDGFLLLPRLRAAPLWINTL